MHARNTYIRIIFLTITMFLCVLSWGQNPKGGQVTVIADPAIICAGESSQLHAEAVTSMIVDFETGDFSQANFNTSGNNSWVIDTSHPYEGSYCMKSNCYHVNNGESSIEATVDVPYDAIMSFYVKVSSESGYDKFSFYIDGQQQGQSLSGNLSYMKKRFNVSQGTHTYKWTYKKDSYYDSYDDCIYVDNITMYQEYVPGDLETFTFDNHTLQGWTKIDADGDGYNWVLGSTNPYSYSTNSGHNGSSDFVLSQSYVSGSGLHPDNYLVSPRRTLGGTLTFYACAYSSSYPAEHFGVAVSTTNSTNASAFTTIQEWTLTAKSTQDGKGSREQGSWHEYTVDLSAYNGQMGYVAIRHFDCTNKWALDVDDITFETEPTTPGGSSGDVIFQWVNGMTGSDIRVSPTQTTTYTVTALQNGNPIGSAQQTVAVYQDPQLSISTNTGSAEICVGDSLVLYVTVGGGTDVKVGDILCTDGSLVKPADWPCEKTAQGIVFYVDATGQHGWAVDLGLIPNGSWGPQSQNISGLQNHTNWMDVVSDLDGYTNTQKIISAGNATQYPAAWAAFNNGGYLPSAGQLNILFGEYFAVNTSLVLVEGVPINSQNNNSQDKVYLWSSTVYDADKVWNVNVEKGIFQQVPKNYSNRTVRAVFDF